MVGIPALVPNLVDGKEVPAESGKTFNKIAPADGSVIAKVARSAAKDVHAAVAAAKRAQPAWADRTPVERGEILRRAALRLKETAGEISGIVARETGKSPKDAAGETLGSVEMAFFVAGEGRRFYGRTTTSAVPNKQASIARQPLGVAGLIVPANTPIPNIAWKAFPALLCGNSAVLKSSEDAPATAWAFARVLQESGAPPGVFNVVHGLGEEAGAPLVDSPDVAVISFTGSVEVGRVIGRQAGARLAKVCLELGGKNPLIVCDDADLEAAVQAAVLSAFSNAGQRCASGSRLIVFDAVYDRFKKLILDRTEKLRVGVTDDDDFGPVISKDALDRILSHVGKAKKRGASILAGGHRLKGEGRDSGFYLAPTILENVPPADPLSVTELFGPVTVLHRVKNLEEALAVANGSPFGLTAAIHTASLHRAMVFQSKIQSGVAVVNGPTYGSEPHMPFGGLKQSGNGLREAGSEALDVFSDWKTIYVNWKPGSA